MGVAESLQVPRVEQQAFEKRRWAVFDRSSAALRALAAWPPASEPHCAKLAVDQLEPELDVCLTCFAFCGSGAARLSPTRALRRTWPG